MQAKTAAHQTRNCNLVISTRAGRNTFLCDLCGLCGEFGVLHDRAETDFLSLDKRNKIG